MELEKVACPECGKEGAKRGLTGHMRTHEAKEHDEDTPADNAENTNPLARNRESLEEKISRLRKTRTPMGVPQAGWNPPPDDGFHYRVFNDNWMANPGRIQQALAAGYEFVEETKGTPIKSQSVGSNDDGSSIQGHLMRIPQVIYDEGQALKNKGPDSVDEQIRSGTVLSKPGDGRYVPPDGIKMSVQQNG